MDQIGKQILKQFFTPYRVVRFMYDFIRIYAPSLLEMSPSIMDPACGEGIFLKVALDMGITPPEKMTGIEKDPTVARKWQEGGLSGILSKGLRVGDSLGDFQNEQFDIVIGNPPLGMADMRDYENKEEGEKCRYQLPEKSKYPPLDFFPVELLFLERFLQLTRPGGICGIIMPQGILSNMSMLYVRRWLRENFHPFAVIAPKTKMLISPGVSALITIIFIKKEKSQTHERIFLSVPEKIHIEGNRRDHLDDVLDFYRKEKENPGGEKADPLGLFLAEEEMEAMRWDPLYYDPVYTPMYKRISSCGVQVVPLKEIIKEEDIISGYKGIYQKAESKKKIPLLTAKNITPLGIDITLDNFYVDEGSRQDPAASRLKERDILLVRCGEGGIGRAVCGGEEDLPANIRWEIYILRFKSPILNPFYLTVFLNCFTLPGTKDNLIPFQIRRLSGGAGTPGINREEILLIKIPLMEMAFQEEVERDYRDMYSDFKKAVKFKHRLQRMGVPETYAREHDRYRKFFNESRRKMDVIIQKTEKHIEKS